MIFAAAVDNDVTAAIETNGWDEAVMTWVAGVAESGTNPVLTAHAVAFDTLNNHIPESAGYHMDATMTDGALPYNSGYLKSPMPKTLKILFDTTGTNPVFSAATLAVTLRRYGSQGSRRS